MAEHLPSTEMLGTTGQQVTVVEAAELEVLAGRTELKEALGHEELADVISQEVGEVWNPSSAARADNPRASYPIALRSLIRVLSSWTLLLPTAKNH